ncbi:unnamed protein product [Onchocerca ochengi]|uniref:Ovule protein n=1 Tax=Onchocerca ochengi TaxID=42157 RepID=A0A182EPW9_ONCOC|nr:unnamed protein product [Onchocerca ochengi]
MAIIILPLYIYFVIRRSRIPIKAANSINYTLLDFEKIHSGKKLEDWREISNVPSSHIDVKDEDIQGKHVAKVYSTSCSDMSSKTAQEATTKSTRSSKIMVMLLRPILSLEVSQSKFQEKTDPNEAR